MVQERKEKGGGKGPETKSGVKSIKKKKESKQQRGDTIEGALQKVQCWVFGGSQMISGWGKRALMKQQTLGV